MDLYERLGLEPEATSKQIKQAYRKMSVAHHPDKVGDMGADYQKQARARFDRIQAAYEEIKKQRGMK